MKQRLKSLGLIAGGFLLMITSVVSVRAQYPAGVKEILATGKPEPMQKLTGLIRVRKDFGVVPKGPRHPEPAVFPCMPFYVAVYDAHALRSKPLAVTDKMMTPGPDQGEFYTCQYEVTAPAGRSLYVIPVMGGTRRLPQEDREPMYITDPWIGGARSTPPKGWERGFVGKYLTLGTVKGTYLKFDLTYAQVDPN